FQTTLWLALYNEGKGIKQSLMVLHRYKATDNAEDELSRGPGNWKPKKRSQGYPVVDDAQPSSGNHGVLAEHLPCLAAHCHYAVSSHTTNPINQFLHTHPPGQVINPVDRIDHRPHSSEAACQQPIVMNKRIVSMDDIDGHPPEVLRHRVHCL